MIVIKQLLHFQKDSESDYDDSMELNAPPVVPIETSVDGMKVESVGHNLPTFEPKVENISSMFDANVSVKEQIFGEGDIKQDPTLDIIKSEKELILKEEHEFLPAKTEITDDVKEPVKCEAKEEECAIKNEPESVFDVGKQEPDPVKDKHEDKVAFSSDPASEVTGTESNMLDTRVSVEEP